MSFPTELSLREMDGIYSICALPIKEIESLYDKSVLLKDLTVCAGVPEKIPLIQTPYLIKINIEPAAPAQLTMKIFGIDIFMNMAENRLKISDISMPVSLTPDKWEMVMLVDRCSVELYLDGGKIYCGTVNKETCCDYNLAYLEMASTADCTIKDLELHALKSIWER